MTEAAVEESLLVACYCFRGWVHNHHGKEQMQQAGRHGAGAVTQSLHLIHSHETESYPDTAWAFKAHPQWHTSSNKATPLILLKEFYQLETKHRWVYRGNSYSNHHHKVLESPSAILSSLLFCLANSNYFGLPRLFSLRNLLEYTRLSIPSDVA